MSDFKQMIQDMFSSIWDCEIDHPMFQETVGELMTAAIHAHEKCVSESNWIPVSERLPKKYEAVLITHRSGVAKAWWNGRVWTSGGQTCYKTVAAWMYLPKPYEGNEQ